MANEKKPDCATKGWVPMPRQHVGKELEATKAFGLGPSVEIVPEGRGLAFGKPEPLPWVPPVATLAGPPKQVQRQVAEPPPAPIGPHGLSAQQVKLCKEYGITPAQFAAVRDGAHPWASATSSAAAPSAGPTRGFSRTR